MRLHNIGMTKQKGQKRSEIFFMKTGPRDRKTWPLRVPTRMHKPASRRQRVKGVAAPPTSPRSLWVEGHTWARSGVCECCLVSAVRSYQEKLFSFSSSLVRLYIELISIGLIVASDFTVQQFLFVEIIIQLIVEKCFTSSPECLWQ